LASAVRCCSMRMRWLLAPLGWLAGSAACSRDNDPRDASRTDTAHLAPAPASPVAPSPAEPAPTPSPTQANSPGTSPSATSVPPGKGATAVVGGARLVLRDCRVEAEWQGGSRQARDVDLPGGCIFVTTKSGAQVEKTEQGDTLLVVSSQPLEGRPGDCDTRVRAVVVRGERLAVSREQQLIRMCGAEGPFDSMMFHALAASSKEPG
jgi:hypothetical protein